MILVWSRLGCGVRRMTSWRRSLIARVEALELENSALKRKLGIDSTNSSTPPSQDSLAAKGKRRAERSGAGAVEGPETRRAGRA